MPLVVETHDLTRFFGEVVGVRELNLSVQEGEIFGFLGPNGAGKTTTIRLLMNFIRSDRGSIEIFGQKLMWGDFDYRKHIGYLPGELTLPENITGKKLLDYWSGLNGGEHPARGRCLEALSLSGEDLQRKTREYSHGMKQKLGIVGALQNKPQFVILDEATQGLDPIVKHAFHDLLREMKIEGCTVFFSSHILSEVEQVADKAAIIRQGKLIASASIDELKLRRRKKVSIIFRRESDINDFLNRFPCNHLRKGNTLDFVIADDLNRLFEALGGFEIDDLNITNPTLEDIFLEFYEESDQ